MKRRRAQQQQQPQRGKKKAYEDDNVSVASSVSKESSSSASSDDNVQPLTAAEKRLQLAQQYLLEHPDGPDPLPTTTTSLMIISPLFSSDATFVIKPHPLPLNETTGKPPKAITCVACYNDIMYLPSKDGYIYTVDVTAPANYKNVLHTKGNKIVHCAALSPDGKHLATGSKTKDVTVYDTETMRVHTYLNRHRDGILGLSYFDQETLFSASKDRSVIVWKNYAFSEELYGHQSDVTCVAACKRGERAVTGGMDSTVRYWKVPEQSQLQFPGVHTAGIECVAVLSDEIFVAGGCDGDVTVWSTNKKKPVQKIDNVHNGYVTSVTAKGDVVVTGGRDGSIVVWRYIDSKVGLKEMSRIFLAGPDEEFGFINGLFVREESKQIICVMSSEHRLGRWQANPKVKPTLYVIEYTS